VQQGIDAGVAKKIEYKVYAMPLAKVMHFMRESHVDVPSLTALHLYALAVDAKMHVRISCDWYMNAQQIFRDHFDWIGVQKDVPARPKPHQAHAALLARKRIHYRPEIRTSNQSFCRCIRLPETSLLAKVTAGGPKGDRLPRSIMVRTKVTAPPRVWNIPQIGIQFRWIEAGVESPCDGVLRKCDQQRHEKVLTRMRRDDIIQHFHPAIALPADNHSSVRALGRY
jgi:hypothetical protein